MHFWTWCHQPRMRFPLPPYFLLRYRLRPGPTLVWLALLRVCRPARVLCYIPAKTKAVRGVLWRAAEMCGRPVHQTHSNNMMSEHHDDRVSWCRSTTHTMTQIFISKRKLTIGFVTILAHSYHHRPHCVSLHAPTYCVNGIDFILDRKQRSHRFQVIMRCSYHKGRAHFLNSMVYYGLVAYGVLALDRTPCPHHDKTQSPIWHVSPR